MIIGSGHKLTRVICLDKQITRPCSGWKIQGSLTCKSSTIISFQTASARGKVFCHLHVQHARLFGHNLLTSLVELIIEYLKLPNSQIPYFCLLHLFRNYSLPVYFIIIYILIKNSHQNCHEILPIDSG